MDPLRILAGKLIEFARAAVELLPQFVVAMAVVVVTWLVVKLVLAILGRVMRKSHLRPSLRDVLRKLIAIAFWLLGLLIAATILFPNLTPAKLLAGLGIGSLAVGLAFKDIFENFLAGILILLREPMRLNDFVECEGVAGQVEKITVRDTYIRQTDGQLVLVPNALLFKNPVHVLTDQSHRRITVICGVAYGEDLAEARKIIKDAVEKVGSVHKSKPVEVFAHAFGASSVDFEVTWWTGSKPLSVRESRDRVIMAVKRALDDAGVEIPFPYRTLTFKEPLALRRGQSESETAK